MSSFNLEENIFELSKVPLTEIFYRLNKITNSEFIKEKNHVRYLNDYLGENGLDAKFVVVEKNYINKDYLIDYSTYYSTCFQNYPKTGFRLHFFSTNLTLKEFKAQFCNSIIEGVKSSQQHKIFWTEYYLGYIVIKPIPNLFIGFTLLKHYNYNNSKLCYDVKREYWGIKDYNRHIFGNKVTIPSLAFQEQDQNVAACATIAIWSMLQIAAEDYYVTLQSPSEITRNGGIVAYNGNRLLPNKGLSILQMAQAITQNNLVTEVRERTAYQGDGSFNLYIKKLIRAYSSLKIPCILLINLSPPDKKQEREAKYPEDEADYDGHAVAVSGYKMRPLDEIKRRNRLLSRTSKEYDSESIIWKADLIEKLYVHDDQWGPFSKMVFSGTHSIKSSWQMIMDSNKLPRIEGLLLSVYNKIRIPYDDIDSKIIRLNRLFVKHLSHEIEGTFVWDIQLNYSETFKHFIQTSEVLDDKNPGDRELQFKVLTKSFPKYIWIATLHLEDQNVMHFIYDATGLSGSNIIHSIFGYFPKFTKLFKDILVSNEPNNNTNFTYIFDYNIRAYIDAIID